MTAIDPELLFLAASRQAVGVLDVLGAGPCGGAELRRAVGGGRRGLTGVVRTLAAYGLIRRLGGHGSWDESASDVYALTDVGLDLATALAEVETWTAIYEQYLRGAAGY